MDNSTFETAIEAFMDEGVFSQEDIPQNQGGNTHSIHISNFLHAQADLVLADDAWGKELQAHAKTLKGFDVVSMIMMLEG